MTDRITKHVSAMKEYGRKPYLVTADAIPYGEKADYRYMMDTTWHKAQDNEGIVVQSVKKKPYLNSDYQTMEQAYDFPIFTFPRWNFNFKFDFPNTIYRRKPEPYPANITKDAVNDASGLNWIQCPSTASYPNIYTVIVRNSFTRRREYENGIQISSSTIFVPTSFKITANTYGAYGLVILDVENRGSTTWARIGVSSVATGSFNIIATDGKREISRIISTFDTTYIGFANTEDFLSITKQVGLDGEPVLWREGFDHSIPGVFIDTLKYDLGAYAGVVGRWGVIYEYERVEIVFGPPPSGYEDDYVYYNFNDSDVWQSAEGAVLDSADLSYAGNNVTGSFTTWDGSDYLTYSVNNGNVSLM